MFRDLDVVLITNGGKLFIVYAFEIATMVARVPRQRLSNEPLRPWARHCVMIRKISLYNHCNRHFRHTTQVTTSHISKQRKLN
ncbi:hypothetical protein CEXT_707791 [Caerostris extrusa]|uniref:Ycf15 n=1 Tax=Caerostris extrusa TaxID=172846 RepID=A0AAV4W3X3_CAEEX|nr:hypothetical protein CEXT_707791 [Caerostris extrusa]